MDNGKHWTMQPVTSEEWLALAVAFASGEFTLVAHWAEAETAYAAYYDPALEKTAIACVAAEEGHFPSLGQVCKPARRLERAIRDKTGLIPDGAPDERPWLDHGRERTSEGGVTAAKPYAFQQSEGEGLHQIAVGPVHAGIIEPGHFRFTCNGETIVRLEARLGYTRKGIEGLMAGAGLSRAATLAARVSGDSTVAYSLAFAMATEDAADTMVPPRAVFLRAIMAELERLANHIGDVGAICNDGGFALMLAHAAVLREKLLRCCDAVFGHRLMMDGVIPGGVARDITTDGIARLQALVSETGKALAALNTLYEDTASLQDRTVRTGMVAYAQVKEFGAGGYIGRASGRAFDARQSLAYAPYDSLTFEVPVLERGDADARVRIRLREAEQSLSLLTQLLTDLPQGAIITPVAAVAGSGAALVEGFRGDIFVWLHLSRDGTVAHCHLRDPSCFQWPLLESAIEGNIVADFPLCNKSFNCSYAGHDL